ncbi:hypothetical protein, partial [Klebsiella pneumoniae]|uniref:hypothetical protein n=1 Tax=Klebsiella pneumoniae TaxID=573 RepID=UPI0024E0C718
MATALKDLYGSQSEKFDQIQLTADYRPSEAEDFMNSHQQAYFLGKLKAWKEAIVDESRATMAQLQLDSMREPDMA